MAAQVKVPGQETCPQASGERPGPHVPRISGEEQRALLFTFDEEKKQNFVMKNAYIPLDMIFISGVSAD